VLLDWDEEGLASEPGVSGLRYHLKDGWPLPIAPIHVQVSFELPERLQAFG